MDLQYLVNDVLMAFFFAFVGKQVWKAVLPGGSLRDPQRALMPILCAVGGMAGPAAIYLGLVALSGRWGELHHGWAIPCATDIAFGYLIARLIFGKGHAGTTFLLLLAIADDALGLLVLAVFYPVLPVRFAWLLLSVAAVGAGPAASARRLALLLVVPGGAGPRVLAGLRPGGAPSRAGPAAHHPHHAARDRRRRGR